MKTLFEGVVAADDIEAADFKFTHDMCRFLSLGVVTVPVPPRLGPDPWHVTIKVGSDAMLEVVRPDEYEITIKVRVRRQRAVTA